MHSLIRTLALSWLCSLVATNRALLVQAKQLSVSPSGVVSGVVSITRTIHTDIITDDVIGKDGKKCDFAGNITFGGPFSLEQGDKFFNQGSRQLVAYQLMVDHINRFKCGIKLSSGNYSIQLSTYDDQSSPAWTSAIGKKLVASNVDIILAGYSSELTQPLAEIAHENGKLLMAPGAASTAVFSGKDAIFGTVPPDEKYLAQAVEGLFSVGARSIATVWEDVPFTKGVCEAAPRLAKDFGLIFTSTQSVTASPDSTVLKPVAEKLAGEDPDIVVACVYNCVPWIEAMRDVNWSPKAQVFTVCVGSEEFADGAGSDAEYIMGVSPWDASLPVKDNATGWSAQDFADVFRNETGDLNVVFQAASAASVISITVQAIEAVDTTNSTLLAEYIASQTFETVYGEVSFDDNGQNEAPLLLIQYDANRTVRTVFPNKTSSGTIFYPMPSWDRRDCDRLSKCKTMGGTCDVDGQCVCGDPDFYPVGAGGAAQCIEKEDMNLIDPNLKGVGYFLVALVLGLALAALGWIYYYRNNSLVKVSQPTFLCLMLLGSTLSILSIIPMGFETEYRNSDDIEKVDAACMAIPWLIGLGFSITFSALFAKVWRVKKLYGASAAIRRVQVDVKDVLFIMAGMVGVETAILLAFACVSPYQWERKVLEEVDDIPVQSVGRCTSESGSSFLASLLGFNVLSLVCALILCFQTKHIPSDFAESNYIFLAIMFMFQIMVLSVPISSMIGDQTNGFYFVRVLAIFLLNFTVLVIIFCPKMLRIYEGEDTLATVLALVRSGTRSQGPVSNISGLHTPPTRSTRNDSDDYSFASLSNDSVGSGQPNKTPKVTWALNGQPKESYISKEFVVDGNHAFSSRKMDTNYKKEESGKASLPVDLSDTTTSSGWEASSTALRTKESDADAAQNVDPSEVAPLIAAVAPAESALKPKVSTRIQSPTGSSAGSIKSIDEKKKKKREIEALRESITAAYSPPVQNFKVRDIQPGYEMKLFKLKKKGKMNGTIVKVLQEADTLGRWEVEISTTKQIISIAEEHLRHFLDGSY